MAAFGNALLLLAGLAVAHSERRVLKAASTAASLAKSPWVEQKKLPPHSSHWILQTLDTTMMRTDGQRGFCHGAEARASEAGFSPLCTSNLNYISSDSVQQWLSSVQGGGERGGWGKSSGGGRDRLEWELGEGETGQQGCWERKVREEDFLSLFIPFHFEMRQRTLPSSPLVAPYPL